MGSKITQFPEATSIVDTDILAVVIDPGGAPNTKKIQISNFLGVWTDYSAVSTIVGWSSFTVKKVFYKKVGKTVFVQFDLSGTSNSIFATFTLPFANRNDGLVLEFPIYGEDAAVPLCTRLFILLSGDQTVGCYSTAAGGVWTASGVKTIRGEFFYQVA